MTAERVRVGEVLSLQRREVPIDPLADYRLIGVYSFGKGIFRREPTPGSELGDYRFFAVEPGDLVLSNIQAWEGAIALASIRDAGTIGTHRFLSYIAAGDRIDTNWARWFFLSEPGMRLIRQAAPGTTVRNRTLAIDRFEALEIAVPPMEEQRRVAAQLDAIADAAVTVAARLDSQGPHALVALLPGLVDAAVERKAAGRTQVVALAAFVSDIVHPGDDPAPADCFIGLQHIESHTGQCAGSDDLDPMKGRKFRFRPGDVVYGYLRPYLNKIWVADRHGLCSVDQYVLRPRPGVSPDLLAHILRGRAVLLQAVDLTHNLQLPRLRSGLLGSIDVPNVAEDRASVLVSQLDRLRDQVVGVVGLRRRQGEMAAALVPAALNEAFGSLS